MMYGVMVYDHTTDKGNLRVTVADSGMYDQRIKTFLKSKSNGAFMG